MKYLVVIAGPTAIGKTSTSIAIAKHFNCDIISADSRQFYQELSIGTAKPTMEEMDNVAHHFIGNLSINQEYTAGEYEKDALTKLNELHKNNDLAILVGGSGLYIDALCKGLDQIPKNIEIRDQLNNKLNREGIQPLLAELEKVDLSTYNVIDKANPHRIIRALEVCRTSGRPYSSFLGNSSVKRDFKIVNIVLTMDREKLYHRINQRVDMMFESGLESEVKSLLPFRYNTALNTVGYSELFKYFDGIISKDKAIELIKRNSRRYAKRQITWFKRDNTSHWMAAEDTNAIIEYIKLQTKKVTF